MLIKDTLNWIHDISAFWITRKPKLGFLIIPKCFTFLAIYCSLWSKTANACEVLWFLVHPSVFWYICLVGVCNADSIFWHSADVVLKMLLLQFHLVQSITVLQHLASFSIWCLNACPMWLSIECPFFWWRRHSYATLWTSIISVSLLLVLKPEKCDIVELLHSLLRGL